MASVEQGEGRRWLLAVIAITFVFGVVVGRATNESRPELLPLSPAAHRVIESTPSVEHDASVNTLVSAHIAHEPRGKESRGGDDTSRSEHVRRQRFEDALYTAVSQLNTAQLHRLIRAGLGLQDATLDAIPDLHQFAFEAAAGAVQSMAVFSETTPPDPASDTVTFSSSVSYSNDPLEPTTRFGLDARQIYAVFPTPSDNTTSVLVRWTRVLDGALMMYREFPINPGAAQNHVWLKIQRGWIPGPYKVQILDATSTEVLSDGVFEVVSGV